MREHNVLSCSKGYIQRVTQSYEEVTLEKVRKYFLNTLKFAKLYSVHGGRDSLYCQQQDEGAQKGEEVPQGVRRVPC